MGKFKSILKTTAKAVLLSLLGLVLFVFGCLLYTVKVLTPERLTPIVEKTACKILNADVSLERVELSIGSHYPFLHLRADDLCVISRDMIGLPDSIRKQIPAEADTLLSIRRFEGGINLPDLARGVITISSVEIEHPSVCIADIPPGICNYNIGKPTAKTETADEESFEIPDIRFESFRLINPGPIRYINTKDSIDATIRLSAAEVTGAGAPTYTLDFGGDLRAIMPLPIALPEKISFGLNGDILWSRKEPSTVQLKNFALNISLVKAKFDTSLDMTDGVEINALTFSIEPVKVSEALDLLPKNMLRKLGLSELRTNASVVLSGKLTKSYNPTAGGLPSIDIKLNIPKSEIKYDRLDISEFYTDIDLSNVDDNPDNATVNIRRLYMRGRRGAVDLSADGKLTHLLSDPAFDGNLKGKLQLGVLPQKLYDAIGARFGGNININSSIKARPSYLNRRSFHKIHIKGSVDAYDLSMVTRDSADVCFVDHALIEFGTNERFVRDTIRSAQLLTASLSIDSASLINADARLTFTGMKAGVGCQNEELTEDTTQIIPIGGTFNLDKLTFVSPTDSSRMRLREIRAFATLRRFEQIDTIPELVLRLHAGRASAGDSTTRLNLRNADLRLNAHPNPKRPKMAGRLRRIADSIVRSNPHLSADSVYAELQRQAKARRIRTDSLDQGREWIDMKVSGALYKVLRNWTVEGNVQARGASLFTPVFPLRNRISGFSLDFDTDSVKLNGMKYKAGRSDFKIYGTISNIRRALTSRRHSPIKINLQLNSDTIDVNQLAAAFFAGAAYTARKDSLNMTLTDTDSDEAMQRQIEDISAQTDSTGPLLIPTDIDANLSVRSRDVIYGDLQLKDMRGEVMIYRGAVNLSNLAAASDAGAIALSALYAAPRVSDMSFGFGMQASRFNISRFLKLVPAVDSILPLLSDMGGIISADMAATCRIHPDMNLDIPSMKAALKIHGDSLTLLDPETFKTVSKWLFFRNKNKNLIDSMSVEILVENSTLKVFPFSFNFDRYKLGVLGGNDFNMNYNYHVAVLKSPIPFKFGVNISGTPDKMKIRLGGSKFKKGMDVRAVSMVDTTRINLIKQIRDVFRRGVDNAPMQSLRIGLRPDADPGSAPDTISAADSLNFINEGMIEAPQQPADTPADKKKNKKKGKKKDNGPQAFNNRLPQEATLPKRGATGGIA